MFKESMRSTPRRKLSSCRSGHRHTPMFACLPPSPDPNPSRRLKLSSPDISGPTAQRTFVAVWSVIIGRIPVGVETTGVFEVWKVSSACERNSSPERERARARVRDRGGKGMCALLHHYSTVNSKNRSWSVCAHKTESILTSQSEQLVSKPHVPLFPERNLTRAMSLLLIM
jgi:hypothetical protein